MTTIEETAATGVDAEGNGAGAALGVAWLDSMKLTAFGDTILGESTSGEPLPVLLLTRGAEPEGNSGGTVGVEGDKGVLAGSGADAAAAACSGED